MLDLVALVDDHVPVGLLHHMLDLRGLVTGKDGKAIALTANDLVLRQGQVQTSVAPRGLPALALELEQMPGGGPVRGKLVQSGDLIVDRAHQAFVPSLPIEPLLHAPDPIRRPPPATTYPCTVATSESVEIDVKGAQGLLAENAVLVDVRRQDEWDFSRIAGAHHIPQKELMSRIEEVARPESKVVVYCAHGNRSLFAATALRQAGYEAVSLAGGLAAWMQAGKPVEAPDDLDEAQRERYSRHVLIPEVGLAGQRRLLDARVLVVGAGGLGSPALLYLAAAGIGRLGFVDDDVVDASNLQRQVLHSTDALGEPKIESAEKRIRGLNPDVEPVGYRERLTPETVDRILGDGWDVVVDGADNVPTRYLLNDASVWHGVPVVHGSIFRFEGQVTVFAPGSGPCYRCLFPQPPPPELAPSCAEGGVLGVLPGVVGSLQGTEALKLVLGIGEPLIGRLLLFDALAASFTEVAVRRDPACPVCGEDPTITEYVDYVEFCGGAR